MNLSQSAIIHQLQAMDHRLDLMFVKGSKVQGARSDYWSDVDLLLVTGAKHIEEFYVEALDEIFQPIHGKQVYRYENCITYRVTGGQPELLQFDLQIIDRNFYLKHRDELLKAVEQIYGEQVEIPQDIQESWDFNHTYDAEAIDNMWFMLYESVKKIGRKDNLIGLHLILDLIRDFLVLEMVDRDIVLETNIHKYGQNEQLPYELDLSLLQTPRQRDKLDFLLALARVIDDKLIKCHKVYESRVHMFEKHIRQSLIILGEN